MTRSARPYFAPALPRVLAHRGLAVEAPENTLLAFARALAAGAIYLETDVHASADGVAVISHDPDLRRLTGREGRLSDLTLAQLRAIDLGADQKFTSLFEALDAFPAAFFNIDIKSADAALPTVHAIMLAHAERRVLLTSFSGERRRRATERLPGVATSASSARVGVALLLTRLRLPRLVALVLRSVDAVQVPETWQGVRIVDDRFIRTVHRAGAEVHVWTVNDPADMRQLLDLGVDGLVTDRADLASAVVADRARKSA